MEDLGLEETFFKDQINGWLAQMIKMNSMIIVGIIQIILNITMKMTMEK
jgi:hypothetical protein